jgi:hypothetical protein
MEKNDADVLAWAILLFYAPEPDEEAFKKLTGASEMSTKVLEDLARTALIGLDDPYNLGETELAWWLGRLIGANLLTLRDAQKVIGAP